MFSANSSQVSDDKLFVEDVFSTYLYTGNGSTQTITNGIDLAGKGGLVWLKSRNQSGGPWHSLVDTARGAGKSLATNTTAAQETYDSVASFSSSGFGIGNTVQNTSPYTYVSWTFRKAPKFFDVVTYTGDGVGPLTVNHNLKSVPGCIIIKRTDSTGDWFVFHRSLSGGFSTLYLKLNTTDAQLNASGGMAVSATNFQTYAYTGANDAVNTAGATYVAYLFAHDTTSDGIIQCGSFTTDGSGNATVSLGWEPQFVITKESSTTGIWKIADNMRGWTDTELKSLRANSTLAEQGLGYTNGGPTATGFKPAGETANATFIYIAIRRGPMRTPTTGTSVFSPLALNNAAGTVNTTGFPVDLQMIRGRGSGNPVYFMDRLRGVNSTSSTSVASPYLQSTSTSAESSLSDMTRSFSNTGYTTTSQWASVNSIYWNFKRAPSFMDVVCYTGTGVAGQTISHNLGVAPELIIIKKRNAASTLGWAVGTTFAASTSDQLFLNTTDAASQTTYNGFITSKPTATAFNVSAYTDVGASAQTYVAYLFASCPGVSKVGTYTGNGSSQTINCGFAAGARFVMIKRTDSTGNWLVGDSARGLVAGNDPLVYMNSDVAEITTLDWLDTDSSGFVVNQDTTANANVNGATYIYLAVA